MGYVDSNLLPNEKVIHRASVHWFIFARPVFVVLLGSLMVPSQNAGVKSVGFGVMLVGIAILVLRALERWAFEGAVTEQRIILKAGLISRNSLELFHDKVDGMSIAQGIIGRMFGFGTVGVSAGTEKQQFRFIAAPIELKKQVQIHQQRARVSA